MPRTKNSVVVYFRFRGHRLTASGSTRDEALANAAVKKAKLEAGHVEISGSTLVKDWIGEWLETYKHTGKINERWYKDLCGICNNYIIPAIGAERIKFVKPIQLQKIINSNKKSRSFNDKLYDAIRQIFRTAYQNGLTPSNIAESLHKAPAQSGKARRSITAHERSVLLRVLDGNLTVSVSENVETPHRGKLFCLLMLYAGLRPGEAAALIWKDIDFSHRTIEINKALKSDGVIRPQPKTDSGFRTVPIQDALLVPLQEAKEKSASPLSFVCVNQKGNPYTKRTIFAMWDNIRRLMNIEMGAKVYRNQIIVKALPDDFVLYNLRNTFCTDLQAAGVPINVARELMGHSDISITSKIYTHHSDRSIDDALDKMNRLNYSDRLDADPEDDLMKAK